jgi:hypothetical protein
MTRHAKSQYTEVALNPRLAATWGYFLRSRQKFRRALAGGQIPLPNHTEKFGNPGSDHGLIEMLGGKYMKGDDDDIDKSPKPYFLVIDEYLNVFAKMGIENSGLPYTFNQLFNFDEIEKSTRKSHIIAFARLSVLGGLTCDDPVDFAKVFGRHTVTGFYDRHLYAICQPDYDWNDEWEANLEHRTPGGVAIPSEIFKLKKEWVTNNRNERDRLGELALRVATVWTAYNHDQVMTMECLRAALRWMEKQEVIRRMYKPGLAETPQGTASEAILNVFRNRRDPDAAAAVIASRCDGRVRSIDSRVGSTVWSTFISGGR